MLNLAETQSTPPGAVVIGGDFQGLAIARSLGRRGIPVVVVDDELSIARTSRYTKSTVRVRDLRDARRTVATLLDTGERLGLDGWVLYPTRDETVAALARYRGLLLERFRVPTPAWETVRVAWDKRATYALAAELGIPTPQTWYPANESELDRIDAEGPFAVKPAIKERFVYATKAKAWRADGRDELRERFREAERLLGPGEAMVQEMVPGDGRTQFSFCAFFKDGRSVATMVVNRRRQHPREFAKCSTYVETVELPALEERSERLLRAIDYYGLVEIEYKRDPRDGEYKLLDVNARTWGSHAIGARAGVDFAYLLYADQVGLPVSACRARPGVTWVRLVTDIPVMALDILGGRASVRGYLESLRKAGTESVLAGDDPLPAAAELFLVPYLAIKRGW